MLLLLMNDVDDMHTHLCRYCGRIEESIEKKATVILSSLLFRSLKRTHMMTNPYEISHLSDNNNKNIQTNRRIQKIS